MEENDGQGRLEVGGWKLEVRNWKLKLEVLRATEDG